MYSPDFIGPQTELRPVEVEAVHLHLSTKYKRCKTHLSPSHPIPRTKYRPARAILGLIYLSTMLDLTSPQLQIIPQPNPFHLLQHPPSTSIPPSLLTDSRYDFMSITRTAEEISIVFSLSVDCDGSDAKAITGIDGMGEALKSEGPWRALRVRGPMDLSGFLLSISCSNPTPRW